MEIGLTTSLISLAGVIISITVTYFETKRTIKIELEKINRQIDRDYAVPLLQKRIEVYPEVYSELSEFMRIIFDHNPTTIELREFEAKLANLSSRYAIFMSARTSDTCYRLRRYLVDIIGKIEQKGNEKIETEDRKKVLRRNIQKFEIGLKRDIGIFIVEFKDQDENLINGEDYEELKEKINLQRIYKL